MTIKKIVIISILFTLILIIFSVFLVNLTRENTVNENKIQIITTLFPQYDFAKQIVKDKANVTLLLSPGTESHTYEPTPTDILNINNSDLFIFIGKDMESLSSTILSSVSKDSLYILDLSKNVNLIENGETEHLHKANVEHEHTVYDPHIWMSIDNAIIMIEDILSAIIKIDPNNEEYYTTNATEYINSLKSLDENITNLVENSENKKIAFGCPFSYIYFTNEYNLEYISAYESCGKTAEPSVSKMNEIINYIKNNNIQVIFTDPLSSNSTANTIANECNVQVLNFYGIHNISKDDLNNNESYLSLMQKNYENLKIALN